MSTRRHFLKSSVAASTALSFADTGQAANAGGLKLYDTHAHFYSADIAKYPFNAGGSRFGAEEQTRKALANPFPPEKVFAMWDRVNIEQGCGVQYNSTYGTDNRYLLDVAAQYPDRIVPVVILSPTDATTPDMLANMARNKGISGVRFTGAPDANGNFEFLGAASEQSWAAANELGLAIVLMPLRERLPEAMGLIGEHAARYPNVKIVIDHFGYPPSVADATFGLSPQHLELTDHPNVYNKYTTLLIERHREGGVPQKDFLHYVVDLYGADQLVWGTDVGNSEVDFFEYVQMALDAAEGLQPEEISGLFHDTARSVFIRGGRGRAA
jgi:L-fuconolactonase